MRNSEFGKIQKMFGTGPRRVPAPCGFILFLRVQVFFRTPLCSSRLLLTKQMTHSGVTPKIVISRPTQLAIGIQEANMRFRTIFVERF